MPNVVKFSRLERQVLELLCLGSPTKQIAYELEMAVQTVNDHIGRIRRKAAVPRPQIIIYALQHPECLERDGESEPGLHPRGCSCESPYCKGRRRAA